MDVGNQIRYYRKENDLSQAELAEKIFVSSQTISNWENERSYPDLHNLIELATLFNVLTKKKADQLLNELKVHIQDFEITSSSQQEKIFRKGKKLKTPDINLIDTKEISYLGWNDNSSNRKYIVYKNLDDKFEGICG